MAVPLQGDQALEVFWQMVEDRLSRTDEHGPDRQFGDIIAVRPSVMCNESWTLRIVSICRSNRSYVD